MTTLPSEHDIALVQRRLEHAHQQFLDEGQVGLLSQILTDASVILEELHVANEEIRSQNDELAAVNLRVHEERRRFEELFDFAPDGYLITDAYGMIREANRTLMTMLSVARHRLIGKPLVLFLADSSHPALAECLARMQTGQQSVEIEMQMQGRDGDVFPASVKITGRRNRPKEELALRWLIRDISELKAERAALRARDAQITALEATISERERIARDLHDGVLQVLGYTRFTLQSVSILLSQGETSRAQETVAELIDAVRSANDDLRQTIFGLRPDGVLRSGLIRALQEYLPTFETQTGVKAELVVDANTRVHFDTATELQLQSIIHEAMVNIRKHARASKATILFTRRDGRSSILITDDGVGFSTEAPQADHFGLSGMRERAQLIGAEFLVESHIGQGTRVCLIVPEESLATS